MAERTQPTTRRGWRANATGDCLAEFFGTFVLVTFGCGVVATTIAALPESGRTETAFVGGGDWLIITLGWAMAVTFGIHVAGGVSGAHLNPAVTLAFAARRGFPWSKVPGYILAQVLGATAGAAVVYGVFFQAINAHEQSNGITRSGGASVGIFVTGPADYFTTYWGPITTEVVGAAFLVVFILAVSDLRNTPPRANLGPVVIGLAVFAIGTSLGANTGYAINPARDLGPRIVAWLRAGETLRSLGRRRTWPRTGGCPSLRRSSGVSSAPCSTTWRFTLSCQHAIRSRHPMLSCEVRSSETTSER